MISEMRREFHGEWLRMRRSLWPDCLEQMHAFEIAQQAGHPDSAVFVHRRENGSLGGFIEVSIRPRVDGSTSERVGYVEGWFVDPDLRGCGVGQQLMLRAEQWTRERGLTELASDAELQNEASIHAHRALGFEETFRLVHFLKKV